MKRNSSMLAGILLVVLAACVHKPVDSMQSVDNPLTPDAVVPLWEGPPPGTEDWQGEETQIISTSPNGEIYPRVSNVTLPTLSVYRSAQPNGTAMLVAPGGGFQILAMKHEGEMVARWLAERGVTSFVLKYRVRMIPGFSLPADLLKYPERFSEFAQSFEPGRPIAIADGLQAMRYLREQADQYGIDPTRIGMMGFSAGAITTMGVILNASEAEMPNFAAPIYGALVDKKPPPANAPPLFIAVTQDDPLVPATESLRIFRVWSKAGLPAELHVYESGGHGFGMWRNNAPSDRWMGDFNAWLKQSGLLSQDSVW